jgi:hypothetical protein
VIDALTGPDDGESGTLAAERNTTILNQHPDDATPALGKSLTMIHILFIRLLTISNFLLDIQQSVTANSHTFPGTGVAPGTIHLRGIIDMMKGILCVLVAMFAKQELQSANAKHVKICWFGSNETGSHILVTDSRKFVEEWVPNKLAELELTKELPSAKNAFDLLRKSATDKRWRGVYTNAMHGIFDLPMYKLCSTVSLVTFRFGRKGDESDAKCANLFRSPTSRGHH